jgi:hypothetical protein
LTPAAPFRSWFRRPSVRRWGSARELLDSRIRTVYVPGIRFSITESGSAIRGVD